MVIKVPGVKAYRSRGKLFVYHRKTGRRIRSQPGTAAFLAEIERLDNGTAQAEPRPGTLGALIEAYRRSPEFAELAPRTRSDYQKIFDYLQPLDGDLLADINSAYVIEIRDAAFAAHKRRFANYTLAVLRLLFAWGTVRDLLVANPAAGVPKLRRPRSAPTVNRAWGEDECAAVLIAATGGVKVAVALGMFAGLREGDAVRITRAAYDGAWLRWKQGKTGNPIEIPVDPALREILDESLTSRAGRVEAMTLVVGDRGAPYTENGFRAMFFRLVRKLAAEGKVNPGLTFHGLRHTAGRVLGDLGTDPRTIAALLGHKTLAMAAHYSEEANRRELAKSAVTKLATHRNRNRAKDV